MWYQSQRKLLLQKRRAYDYKRANPEPTPRPTPHNTERQPREYTWYEWFFGSSQDTAGHDSSSTSQDDSRTYHDQQYVYANYAARHRGCAAGPGISARDIVDFMQTITGTDWNADDHSEKVNHGSLSGSLRLIIVMQLLEPLLHLSESISMSCT